MFALFHYSFAMFLPDCMYRWIRHSLRQSREDPDSDQQRCVGLRQHRRQQRQDGRRADPEQEDPFPTIFCRKIATGNLGEDVAVEKTCQDQTLRL